MSAVKERPILFSSPMVRAILAGTKTQTRRVIKPQSEYKHVAGYLEDRPEDRPGIWTPWEWFDDGRQVPCDNSVRCPYGRPGDRLWVRENWRVAAWREDGRLALDYQASPEIVRTPWLYPESDVFNDLAEQSTHDCVKAGLLVQSDDCYHWEHGKSPCRWRPSIHMPRWASRILLEVTEVRVQRLQEISEEDAQAEGVDRVYDPEEEAFIGSDDGYFPESSYTCGFANLWDRINAKRGHGWDTNPWVWCLSFRVISTGGPR